MRIVELGDYSMVIMKDSEDLPWMSVGATYRTAERYRMRIAVDKGQLTFDYLLASEWVYSAGKLILFFSDAIPGRFHLYDRVELYLL